MVPKGEVVAVEDMLLGIRLQFVPADHRWPHFRCQFDVIIGSLAVCEDWSHAAGLVLLFHIY